MGETVIVVDTNQFRHSPMLRSATWTELFSKADEWGLRFVIPEVCFLEAISVVRRKWVQDRAAVAKLQLGEFGMTGAQQEIIAAMDTKIDGYEQALQARLAEVGAEIVPLPDAVGVLDVAQRAINRRAPYPVGDGTKDAFRDTLIWYTTMDVAAADSGCEVWLVSENHTDFGDRATENREACPHPFQSNDQNLWMSLGEAA